MRDSSRPNPWSALSVIESVVGGGPAPLDSRMNSLTFSSGMSGGPVADPAWPSISPGSGAGVSRAVSRVLYSGCGCYADRATDKTASGNGVCSRGLPVLPTAKRGKLLAVEVRSRPDQGVAGGLVSDASARPDVVSWTRRDDPAASRRLVALLLRPPPTEREKAT